MSPMIKYVLGFCLTVLAGAGLALIPMWGVWAGFLIYLGAFVGGSFVTHALWAGRT